jgi:multidrug resistance efflux pump
VQAGAYLLSIVPDEDIWVQANFKETQIGQMQPGQKAELTFDAYSDTPIEGASTACSPPQARSSACCRRTMPPATSPKSCSGFR